MVGKVVVEDSSVSDLRESVTGDNGESEWQICYLRHAM